MPQLGCFRAPPYFHFDVFGATLVEQQAADLTNAGKKLPYLCSSLDLFSLFLGEHGLLVMTNRGAWNGLLAGFLLTTIIVFVVMLWLWCFCIETCVEEEYTTAFA